MRIRPAGLTRDSMSAVSMDMAVARTVSFHRAIRRRDRYKVDRTERTHTEKGHTESHCREVHKDWNTAMTPVRMATRKDCSQKRIRCRRLRPFPSRARRAKRLREPAK